MTPNLAGSVDVPMLNATVSSQLFVFGWAFEQVGSVSRIDVLVDGAVAGQALYGFIARPGVQQVYPNAPLNSGFSFKLDTRRLPNGVHSISVRVTDAAGNAAFIQWPQANITVVVNNPPPVPTGPVANISLTAPKTSLLVGDIVQATATATDSSGNPVVPQYSWSSSNNAVAKVTPTGVVLGLAQGTNVSVSASAGGKTATLIFNVASASGIPGTIRISIGPEETVFKASMDACWGGDLPDSPAHAVRLSDGTLMLDFGNNPLWFMSFGQNFNSLQRSCSTPVWVSIDDTSPGSFTNQQWINSVYREGSVIHGLIHNEFHDHVAPYCPSIFYSCLYVSVTYASSSDGGATFVMPPSPLHLVAPPWTTWDPTSGQAGSPPAYGYLSPTNIVRASDGYFYSMFRALDHRTSYADGYCVMRTQTLSDPASWRAWNGSSFSLQMTNPYTGTPPAACTRVTSSFPGGTLTYNTYLNRFMFVSEGVLGNPAKCGYYFSLSSDLVNWSPPQFFGAAYLVFPPCSPPMNGITGSIAYLSLIDHEDPSINFETPGRTPYMYLMRCNNADCSDRHLIRFPLIITQF